MKKRIPLTGSQSGEVAQVEFDPEQTGPWVVGGGPERTRAGAVGQAWGGGEGKLGRGRGPVLGSFSHCERTRGAREEGAIAQRLCSRPAGRGGPRPSKRAAHTARRWRRTASRGSRPTA